MKKIITLFGILFIIATPSAIADNEFGEVGEISEVGETYRNTNYNSYNYNTQQPVMNNQLNTVQSNSVSSFVSQPINTQQNTATYYGNSYNDDAYRYLAPVTNGVQTSQNINPLNTSSYSAPYSYYGDDYYKTNYLYNNSNQLTNQTVSNSFVAPTYYNDDFSRYYTTPANTQTNLNPSNNQMITNTISNPYYYNDDYNRMYTTAPVQNMSNTLNNYNLPYYSDNYYDYNHNYIAQTQARNFSDLNMLNNYYPYNNNQTSYGYSNYTQTSTLGNNYIKQYNMDYCSNFGGATLCF